MKTASAPYMLFSLFILAFRLSAQENNIQKLESIAIIDQEVMMPCRDSVRFGHRHLPVKTDKPVPVIFLQNAL